MKRLGIEDGLLGPPRVFNAVMVGMSRLIYPYTKSPPMMPKYLELSYTGITIKLKFKSPRPTTH